VPLHIDRRIEVYDDSKLSLNRHVADSPSTDPRKSEDSRPMNDSEGKMLIAIEKTLSNISASEYVFKDVKRLAHAVKVVEWIQNRQGKVHDPDSTSQSENHIKELVTFLAHSGPWVESTVVHPEWTNFVDTDAEHAKEWAGWGVGQQDPAFRILRTVNQNVIQCALMVLCAIFGELLCEDNDNTHGPVWRVTIELNRASKGGAVEEVVVTHTHNDRGHKTNEQDAKFFRVTWHLELVLQCCQGLSVQSSRIFLEDPILGVNMSEEDKEKIRAKCHPFKRGLFCQ